MLESCQKRNFNFVHKGHIYPAWPSFVNVTRIRGTLVCIGPRSLSGTMRDSDTESATSKAPILNSIFHITLENEE